MRAELAAPGQVSVQVKPNKEGKNLEAKRLGHIFEHPLAFSIKNKKSSYFFALGNTPAE